MARTSRDPARYSLDPEDGRSVVRPARPLSAAPDVSSALSAMGSRRCAGSGAPGSRRRPVRARRHRSHRGLHRRFFRLGEKRGPCVGKTKRGKGTKIMAIADSSGLPVAVWIASASPHEVTLVEATLDQCLLDEPPARLIGDKAYDSDGLDERLREERGIELIAPHRSNRKRKTQDGRPLRRYRRRWRVERFFAWLQNFRRLVTRWEYHADNFLGMLHLACILILLRRM